MKKKEVKTAVAVVNLAKDEIVEAGQIARSVGALFHQADDLDLDELQEFKQRALTTLNEKLNRLAAHKNLRTTLVKFMDGFNFMDLTKVQELRLDYTPGLFNPSAQMEKFQKYLQTQLTEIMAARLDSLDLTKLPFSKKKL